MSLRTLSEQWYLRATTMRWTASRAVRLIVTIVFLYMVGNFGARFFFSATDLRTPGEGGLRRSALKGAHANTGNGLSSKHPSHAKVLHKNKSPSEKQELVDYMGKHLDVKVEITNNLIGPHEYIGKITITNTGSHPIPSAPWRIYFYNPYAIENVHQQKSGAELANRMIYVSHINGGLYQFQPTSLFTSIQPSQSLKIPYKGAPWTCSKSSVFPNWYVSMEGVVPALIQNTVGEKLSFVADFDKEPLWKRNNADNHNPFTPKQRFMRNEVEDLGGPAEHFIPTPLHIKVVKGRHVKVNTESWVVVGSKDMQNEVSYLADKTGIKEVQFQPKSKYIRLQQGLVDLPGADVIKEEGYMLIVDPDTESITITGPKPASVFYGVQSLLSMLDDGKTLPVIRVMDAPRFKYRGFMLDVSRNFRTKEEVMKIIDAMSMYKLNKFHFHLTDDEGWRIEIPDLPELTSVGSKRCHDTHEEKCLLPFLGSHPHGLVDEYYTVDDYREILKYAKQRHVEVIPEIDVPGHSHAMIKSMQLRYKKLAGLKNNKQAAQYLLNDPEDKSGYLSIQKFTDNVLNVCLNSTYAFIETVLVALIDMHKDIQPLHTFHIGGDEVPKKALMHSPKCQEFLKSKGFTSQTNITNYFTERVYQITSKYGISVQGWEDVYFKNHVLQKYGNVSATTVNVWANVWTGHNVYRSHKLANNGYKVILGPATHLYFDHPYEPHPEERGNFWATRFVDTYKVFGFMPESFYDNMDIDGFGHPITPQEICKKSRCPKLNKPQNVIGMGAHLWSEMVRTEQQLHEMVFPRMIALAERAWHRANWELETNANKRERRKNEDWNSFANTIGYHELPRLEKRGIKYRLPVPGALIEDGKLKMNSAIPGLPFVASTDGGVSWVKLENNNRISGKTLLATSSVDGTRRSRSIEVVI